MQRTRKSIEKSSLWEKAEEQLKIRNAEITLPQTDTEIKQLIHE